MKDLRCIRNWNILLKSAEQQILDIASQEANSVGAVDDGLKVRETAQWAGLGDGCRSPEERS